LPHQPDAQPVAREQQGQGAADDAGTANTNIKGMRHGVIVGAGHNRN
jgi:hypothetical protein